MIWWKKDAPASRRPPTSTDPVGDAIAGADPVKSREPSLEISVADLRDLIEVFENQPTKVLPFNTVAHFDDECQLFADFYEDGYDAAVEEQPGIESVGPEDRELCYLQSTLSLSDVHAALIRALVSANRNPREVDRGMLSDAVLDELTADLAPLLVADGFVQHPGPSHRYFHRPQLDNFVDLLFVGQGLGTLSDGTPTTGTVELWLCRYSPELTDTPVSDLMRLPPAYCFEVESAKLIPVDSDAVITAYRQRAVPYFAAVKGRSDLARWWASDPERIAAPVARPGRADILASWGFRDEAEVILRHTWKHWKSLRQQVAKVAERHGLVI